MKCDICGIEIETIDDAINADWIPSFYDKEQEHGPVCPACSEVMLREGDDGCLELKPEYHGKIEYTGGDCNDSNLETEDISMNFIAFIKREEPIH